jgi:F0F1-type ATP synthase membrane subunit b/b'
VYSFIFTHLQVFYLSFLLIFYYKYGKLLKVLKKDAK